VNAGGVKRQGVAGCANTGSIAFKLDLLVK